MYFTNSEKAAILKVMASIIVADKKVHPNESNWLEIVSSKLGVDPLVENLADNMNQNETSHTISNMNIAQKRMVCAILIGAMMADNEADWRESMTLNYIISECNLPRLSNSEYQQELALLLK